MLGARGRGAAVVREPEAQSHHRRGEDDQAEHRDNHDRDRALRDKVRPASAEARLGARLRVSTARRGVEPVAGEAEESREQRDGDENRGGDGERPG